MLSIKIEIPKNEINQDTACLKRAVDKAITRSLGKTIISTRAEWARLIHQELYLSIGTIKSAITYDYSGSTGGTIIVDSATSAKLLSSRRKRRPALPLKQFTPRKTRTGVSVAIKKKSGRKNIPNAFMWRTHVWRREENQNGQGLVGRLPIEMKMTTAIEDVATDHLTEIEKFAQKRLNVVFPRQLEYELSKC